MADSKSVLRGLSNIGKAPSGRFGIPGLGGGIPGLGGGGGGGGGGTSSADSPACKATGVTDSGVASSARWKSIISAAVMAYNTWNSVRMASLQHEIGQNYLQLAEDHRNYYNNQYKPLEINLAQEAKSLPKYVRDKESMYTGQMLTTVRGRSAGSIDRAMSSTGRYSTGLRASLLNDMLLENSMVESTVAGLGYRYTDREQIVRDNLRWAKREQVERIGRDIPAEAVSYATLASTIFGNLGMQAGKSAEGAARFLAYNSNRRETNYPERRGELTVSNYTWTPTSLSSGSKQLEPSKASTIKPSAPAPQASTQQDNKKR